MFKPPYIPFSYRIFIHVQPLRVVLCKMQDRDNIYICELVSFACIYNGVIYISTETVCCS
jgi:hypothetical protein